MEEPLAQMETPCSPGKPGKSIEPVFDQNKFDENIRKSKEEADRPRVEHEAAMDRDEKGAFVWCVVTHLLLIAAIIVAIVRANYEVALLAGGVLGSIWFYLHIRLVDRSWIRGPHADDKPTP